MVREMRARPGRAAGSLLVLVAFCALFAGASHAQRAWVKDEVRLNLRTGPGVEYRILGVMKTGDEGEILAREEGWTQVRVPGVGDGWLPEGYLVSEPPAEVRLSQNLAELEQLRAQVSELSARSEGLASRSSELASLEKEQSTQLERLTRENMQLRAGARWPEWITGACVLSAGMIVGAMLHRSSAGKRRATRVRL